jgi:hypothetical protein
MDDRREHQDGFTTAQDGLTTRPGVAASHRLRDGICTKPTSEENCNAITRFLKQRTGVYRIVRGAVPVLCAFVLLLASGVVHRLWTGARTDANTLAELSARLENVPWTIGDWKGQPAEIDERQFKAAGVNGHLVRRYVQRGTGKEVLLLIVCGKPGPISVHTPNNVHGGAGFETDGAPTQYRTIVADGAPAAEFLKADMHQPGLGVNQRLRVYWTWKSDGPWRAPKHQRWAFGGVPVPYNL